MLVSVFRLLAASLVLPLTRSCGVLIHNQIVQRSGHIFSLPNSVPQYRNPQQLFSPLLTSAVNAPSVQAGAFFPDWGYQCFSTDEDAEAAHWPPFLIAAVEYIGTKYGTLNETANAMRSEDEQQHLESLIAFIFAVASHQTADATWHAIRLPTGLLAALAGVDFRGDINEAHKTLDIGGDFLAAARLGRLPEESHQWIENSWVVPVDDLVAIYERMGRSISKPVMRYCCMRGLAALRSELALGKTLFEKFAAKSPMLVDEIDGYYLGGIDEMTARTVNCWANLTSWFSSGISKEEKLRDGWGICDVFQAIKARGGSGPDRHRASLGSWRDSDPDSADTDIYAHHRHGILEDPRLYKAAMKEMESITVTRDRFGAETYTSLRRIVEVDTSSRQPVKKNGDMSLFFDDPIYVLTFVPYGHLGASISAGFFTADPDELSFAVGAPWESADSSRPGEGSIYIVPDSFITQASSHSMQPNSTRISLKLGAGHWNTAETKSRESSVDQRFGTATTSFSALDDTFLVVSAPGPLTYDPNHSPSLPFRPHHVSGRVDLFLPGSSVPDFTIWQLGAELGSIGNRQWGENLLSAPLYPDSDDEFLIISGSRSDGRRVCNGREKPQYGEGDITIIQLHDSYESMLVGSKRTSTMMAGQRHAMNTTCVASSRDTMSTCLSAKNRMVNEVNMDILQLSLPESERTRVPCDYQGTYARYGAATAFSPISKILWVSAPGRGKVFGYRFFPDMPVDQVATIADDDFALRPRRTGFGHAIATGILPDGREWVAVSAPNEDVDGVNQVGVVRLYQVVLRISLVRKNDKLAVVRVPVATLIREIVPDVVAPYTKFGRSLAGDADNGLLWIGSEFYEGENGAVWAVDLEEVFEQSTWVGRSVGWMFDKLLWVLHKLLIREPLGVGRGVAGARYSAEVVWEGVEAGARFGAKIVAVGGDVFIGMPWLGIGKVEQDKRFFGALAVFRKMEGNPEEL